MEEFTSCKPARGELSQAKSNREGGYTWIRLNISVSGDIEPVKEIRTVEVTPQERSQVGECSQCRGQEVWDVRLRKCEHAT